MATANTLIRSGRCVTVKGTVVILTAATPGSGKVSIDFNDAFVADRLADELRKSLEMDGGERYHEILAIWYALVKKALGVE